MHHLPDNEILVTRAQLDFAAGVRGRLRGYLANTHWPTQFTPTIVELAPEPFAPFPRSLRLTEAGDVTLVPAANPTVYLVAHDPDSAAPLAERRLVHPVAEEVAAA